MTPFAPGGRGERERGEAVVVDAEPARAWRSRMRAALIVVAIGRKPPVASAKPVTEPVPSATGAGLIAEATPEVPIETSDVAGPEAHAERGGHVVAGAAGDRDARGGLGQPTVGRARRARGSATRVADGARSAGRAPLALRGGEVAGAGGVAAVGEGGRARRARAWRETSRGAAAPRRDACGALGLVVAQPAQLGGGERGDQHAADGVGARLRAAELRDQVARPPRRSGCRSRAGRRAPGSPSSSRATMPCC